MRAQKENRSAGEKALHLLREYIIIMSGMLVEMWVVKVILMRSQTDTLPNIRGKAILVIK